MHDFEVSTKMQAHVLILTTVTALYERVRLLLLKHVFRHEGSAPTRARTDIIAKKGKVPNTKKLGNSCNYTLAHKVLRLMHVIQHVHQHLLHF